jgi:hypothetical protein
MTTPKKSTTKPASVKEAGAADNLGKASGEAGEDQVQAQVDAENAKGLRGDEVDPTPNENYTVPGVAAGLPTPENSHPENPAEGIHN